MPSTTFAKGVKERGLLIALSGVDSAGKSTQKELLLAVLRSRRPAPVILWTRAGYTPGLEWLKRLVRILRGRRKTRPGDRVSAEPGRYPRRAADLGHPLLHDIWLTAALLDLLWTYGVRVRLWRLRGKVVLCDRYLLDCLVDFRVNFPGDQVERRLLGRWLTRLAARPDAAFCLMVPPEVSMERSRGKARFHWESADTLGQRWREYSSASEEFGIRVLDGTLGADELARLIEHDVGRARVPADLQVAPPRTAASL